MPGLPVIVLQRLTENEISVYTKGSSGEHALSSSLIWPPLTPGSLAYTMKKDHLNEWVQTKIIACISQKAHQEMNSYCVREGDAYLVSIEGAVFGERVVPGRYLASYTPATAQFPIGTRVLAKLYVGIVAEVPNNCNSKRYLVFYDSGRAEYCNHHDLRVVCHNPDLGPVWDLIPDARVRNWVRHYLTHYFSCLPMVRLTMEQSVSVEWEGEWTRSKVVSLDGSLACLRLPDGQTEWVHRGSPRLAPVNGYNAQIVHVNRPSKSLLRSRGFGTSFNSKQGEFFVELVTPGEDHSVQKPVRKSELKKVASSVSSTDEISKPKRRGHRYKRKLPKGTTLVSSLQSALQPRKYRRHQCKPKCVSWTGCTPTTILAYNHFLQPLMFGFQRLTNQKNVFYKTPCGLNVKKPEILQCYLLRTQSAFMVDQFCFDSSVNVLRQFKESETILHLDDITEGKEKVGVSCVNELDDDAPVTLNYLTGTPYQIDAQFLSSCDCLDNCQDVTKCSCQQLTLEGRAYNSHPQMGYEFRRLLQPVKTGIYECNSRCKCSASCGNRVAQHPMSCRLQLFKTERKGWGLRCLHDLPKGTFISTYQGSVLTESQADKIGKKYGDQFLAELDFIECVENTKEGYEAEAIEPDYYDGVVCADAGADYDDCNDEEDRDSGDPDFKVRKKMPLPTLQGNWQLRLRERKPKDSINKEVSKPSTRKLFGPDEEVFIIDAKTNGNISRYFNHSCNPNVIVQNVFVETQDMRFPTVAFFAGENIVAGTELTWDYSYDLGIAPHRRVQCHCKSANCRGRLL